MPFFRNFIQNFFEECENNDNERRGLYTYSDPDSTFQIFTNPLEMMQYFETRIVNMMKDMMIFRLGDDADQNLPKISPPPNQKERSLRDQFLKPNCTLSSNDQQLDVRIDTTLDGKINVNDILLNWKNFDAASDNEQLIQSNDDGNRLDSSESHLNFPYSHMSIKPNITMERSTITDNAGYTETIIKRQYGDKVHTIMTKRDKDNVETKVEYFANINEDDTWPGSKFGGTLFGESLWGRFINPHSK